MTGTNHTTTIVTGASRGIGAAAAERLATDGFAVGRQGRRPPRRCSAGASANGQTLRIDGGIV